MTLSKSIFSINIQTNSLNIKLVRQLCNYNIRGFSPWWCFLMVKPPQFYCCLCHRHNSSSSSSSSSSSLRPFEDSLCCVFTVFSFADCRSLSRQIWTKYFDFWPRLDAFLCWGSQRTKICTGTSLWCFADEVYQDNVYAEGVQFHSCKKVLRDLGDEYSGFQLISLNSSAKGYTGE